MINYLLILTFLLFSGSVVSADSAVPWQFGFQDPASPVAEGIIRFHHDLMFVLIVTVVFVAWMLMRTVMLFEESVHPVSTGVVHGTVIEVVWTIIPALILMGMALPSITLLYCMDELIDPSITLKIVGHQWYWTYEYSDYMNDDGETLVFDSYMIPEDELQVGNLRLLEVDNRVVLPINTHIRLIITAADVLHCWTVPSFGVKMDACPGRLNQSSLFINREGVFYGQCSEICGINHGFMPIAVEGVSMNDYIAWVNAKLEEV